MAFDLSKITKNPAVKTAGKKEESIWEKELFSFRKPFSKKQKETFYTELGILLQSGVHLKESLELIALGLKNKKDKTIILQLIDSIVKGNELAFAMDTQPYFTRYEVQSIKIGEETAQLYEVVNGLASYYKNYNAQRRELISALTYPAIVMATAILVVFFMLNYVVPIFQDLFKRNQIELPWVTKVVLWGSEWLQDYFYTTAIGIVVVVVVLNRISKTARWKRFIGSFLLRIPLVNSFVVLTHISRFINAMSLLTKARLGITKSLELCEAMTDFYPLKHALLDINAQLTMGATQSQAFAMYPKLFDNKLIAMIQVSEQTNQSELVYEKLQMRYDDVLKQQSRVFTSIINPILTLIIGLIVGFILVALYLPMFRLSTVIG